MYHSHSNRVHTDFTRRYVFLTVHSGLIYNNLVPFRFTHIYVTFRYFLSSTSTNDQLYILTDIIYYTDTPSNIRRILTRCFIYTVAEMYLTCNTFLGSDPFIVQAAIKPTNVNEGFMF